MNVFFIVLVAGFVIVSLFSWLDRFLNSRKLRREWPPVKKQAHFNMNQLGEGEVWLIGLARHSEMDKRFPGWRQKQQPST